MGSFFLHGALAWGTLALVSIPIIIHLLNRRRFRRVDWAAMEFLLEALKRNRRRVRLESLLLLLVRIALMALLGLALARPMLSDQGFGWLSGAFRSEEKVFILDDSFSMTRREADRSAFQRASEGLAVQVRRMGERGGGDRLTVLRASRPQSPIVRGVFVDRERAATLEQSLSRLSPTDTRMRLAEALVTISELSTLDGADGPARPRAISILTDLRASDWTAGPGGTQPNGAVAAALTRLTESAERPTRIVVLDVGGDDPANIAITDVRIDGGKPIANVPATFEVDVRNAGLTAARSIGVRLRFAAAPAALGPASGGASLLGPSIDELGPGETRTVTATCTFRTAGPYGLLIELTGVGDALPGDDVFPVAVEVTPGTDVLLVNGEPSSDPYEGETDYLAEALSPRGDIDSGLRPEVILDDALGQKDLTPFAAVFLANVNNLPEQLPGALRTFVEEGGTLVVFPGDQTDATLLNRQLAAAEPTPAAEPASPEAAKRPATSASLLPARLRELKTLDPPVTLAAQLDHPYFRVFREAPELLSLSRFSRLFEVERLSSSQVLASFRDPNASPALLERAVGKGRVLLFTMPGDAEWSDWPTSPSYLMLLQEITKAAARSRAGGEPSFAGSVVRLPVDIAVNEPEARWRPVLYPDAPEVTLRAAPAADTPPGAPPRFEVVIDDTYRAGLAALLLKTKTGEEEWRQLALRRDPRESDLTRLSAERLTSLYPDAEITVLKDSTALAEVGRGGFEVSDALLWGFLAFLLLESILARWFARHRAPS